MTETIDQTATGETGETVAGAAAAPSAPVELATLAAGAVVAERTIRLTRDSLVRYAGASGDFNPIHYRDDVARSVGLAGVLAHGMLTMGAAVQPVVDVLGDPARILEYGVRFTRPVLVDADAGAEVTITAKIGKPADEHGVARIDLTVSFGGQTVLGKAQALARVDGVSAVLPGAAGAAA